MMHAAAESDEAVDASLIVAKEQQDEASAVQTTAEAPEEPRPEPLVEPEIAGIDEEESDEAEAAQVEAAAASTEEAVDAAVEESEEGRDTAAEEPVGQSVHETATTSGEKKKSLFGRLSDQLTRTRESFTYQLDSLFVGKKRSTPSCSTASKS